MEIPDWNEVVSLHTKHWIPQLEKFKEIKIKNKMMKEQKESLKKTNNILTESLIPNLDRGL